MTNELAADLLNALPEELRETPEVRETVRRVTELETAHADARLQQMFLERAPREGLLYPGDALKLEDVARRLRESDDPSRALGEIYRELRASRPYLFSKPPAAPEKLTQSAGDRTESLSASALTRQLVQRRRKN